MKKTRSHILTGLLCPAPFVVSFAFWDSLPERMASHWDWRGRVDGWMPRTMALLFLPVLNAVLYLLFLLIPLVDPLRKNIAEFRKYCDGFVAVFLVYMLAIHCQTVLWSGGVRINPLLVITPGMSLLLLYLGVLLSKARPNRFIGIRTPWTMSSPGVCERTHRLGSALFKVLGGLSLVSVLFRPLGLILVMGLLLLSSIFLVLRPTEACPFTQMKNA